MSDKFYDHKGNRHDSEGSAAIANAMYQQSAQAAQASAQASAQAHDLELALMLQRLRASAEAQLNREKVQAQNRKLIDLLESQAEEHRRVAQFQRDVTCLEHESAEVKFAYLLSKVEDLEGWGSSLSGKILDGLPERTALDELADSLAATYVGVGYGDLWRQQRAELQAAVAHVFLKQNATQFAFLGLPIEDFIEEMARLIGNYQENLPARCKVDLRGIEHSTWNDAFSKFKASIVELAQIQCLKALEDAAKLREEVRVEQKVAEREKAHLDAESEKARLAAEASEKAKKEEQVKKREEEQVKMREFWRVVRRVLRVLVFLPIGCSVALTGVIGLVESGGWRAFVFIGVGLTLVVLALRTGKRGNVPPPLPNSPALPPGRELTKQGDSRRPLREITRAKNPPKASVTAQGATGPNLPSK